MKSENHENSIIFDDIGSFPLPEGITKEWVDRAVKDNEVEYLRMVEKAFLMKIKAGIEVPNYPQFQDMVQQFMNIIEKEENWVEPYLIPENKAEILELKAIKRMKYSGELRMCVTGPFELFYNKFGETIYPDVLMNLAYSLRNFIKNAQRSVNVSVVSIDEPSLGLNPQLQPEEDLIKDVMEIFHFDEIDVQIHLHSPVFYTHFLDVKAIDVIGIESALNPMNIEFVDPEMVDDAGKHMRIGIARTDIDGLISEYNSTHGVNLWKEKERISSAISTMENVSIIKKRLMKAYNRFGDLLRYIGPDCGLGSWPTQESAVTLLSNVRKALDEFREETSKNK